mmetsp:Transcript_15729/g.30391  ORF Transcript_15729/g.30391 Transcript_15729/m.30391 type:complete len:412 (-) Transcript_15729:223-1458(-)|eukprot:CAMPEP_0171485098 /NCGR_PEP_ID=MMETSP0958-20121227/360_1 /TAXON_ID=87120 /ORGANISM="Aurantiochytrium limacinum, Strain ATCCMYA-1381" /LENGTH=411 /DNA_ID=CAMNT_0012017857 /DNA_START=83 /DNA_END=1318 /DNA_ORIENTATION=-
MEAIAEPPAASTNEVEVEVEVAAAPETSAEVAAATSAVPEDITNLGPFVREGEIIKEGDVVIIFENHTNINRIKVKSGETFEHRLGTFHMDHFIGKRYGSRLQPMRNNMNQRKRGRTSRSEPALVQVGGYVTLLPMTPELWCDAVQRRTAIMYPLDNAMVASHLHLRPGSIVVESGTGSGCLTNFLARAVAPHGRVHTFEFNESRVKAAKQDFAEAKLDDVINCSHANVYENGFGEGLEGKVDAVFLDLPAPWLAIPHAMKVIKPFGRICTFSPCIEQVQRSVSMLGKLGFSGFMTLECLPREYRITKIKTTVPVCFQSAEEKEELQRLSSRNDKGGDADAKRQRLEAKKQKVDMRPFQTSTLDSSVAEIIEKCARPLQEKEYICADRVVLPYDRQKGHTGYLTFAYAPMK